MFSHSKEHIRKGLAAALAATSALTLAACSTLSTNGNSQNGSFTAPRRVDFVVHSAPGGGMDIAARQWVKMLQQEQITKGRWIINNKSGGSGAEAMAYTAQHAGQDDVITGMTTSWVTLPLTTKGVKYSVEDFTPIAQMVHEQSIVVTSAKSKYKSFSDFVNAARTTPGLVQVGGVNTGVDNLDRLIIQRDQHVKWNYLNLESDGERVSALLNGDAQIYITEPQKVAPQIKAGTVRVIGALSDKRIGLYPKVPTLREQGITANLPPQTRGILGPPRMSKAAVNYYAGVFGKLVKSKAWQKYAQENALETDFVTHDKYKTLLKNQVDTYTKLLRSISTS